MNAEMPDPFVSPPDIEEIAKQHPEIVAELRKLDFVRTVATLGGLLTMPELQANCLRLEALAHLAAVYCAGSVAPTRRFFRRSFRTLGCGYCGVAEDPAENLFTALVNTPDGNFRLFEGLREGNAFHLQTILNVVEHMPREASYDAIRKSVGGLLKLSDALAARAHVREYSLGQELPIETLPLNIAAQLSSARERVRFSEADLARLAIPRASLSAFEFGPADRGELLARRMGHTELERRPIIASGQFVYLSLPTAIGSAITRFVIEAVVAMRRGEAFERALAGELGQILEQTRVLGSRSGALRFQRIRGGHVASMMKESDPGRHLHLVFFVDGLDGFFEDGLSGLNPEALAIGSVVDEYVARASSTAKAVPGFRDGISLFVACGYGRGLVVPFERDPPASWRFEWIPAHDLTSLSWLADFNWLSLWRVLDAKDAIQRQGTMLLNASGLLNLVAWSRQLKGHLVPHAQLPPGFLHAWCR